MSTPDRVLGSDPLDTIRVTLSRQLRAVLYRAGVVDSPDLPLYAAPRTTTTEHNGTAPDAPPSEAEILARLAACTRDTCEDCGCEEFCVDYLRARLAEFATTPDHTGPATDAGASMSATGPSMGHGSSGGEKYRPREEDDDGGSERPPQAGGSVHRGPRRADGDPRVRVAAGPHRVHGGGSLPTALPASRGAVAPKRKRPAAGTAKRLKVTS